MRKSKPKRDTSYKKLVKSVVKIARGLSRLAEEQLKILNPTIEQIINEKETDQKKIEHTLDALLDCAYLKKGEKEFEELITYYESVNPEAAKNYREYYQEIVEDN